MGIVWTPDFSLVINGWDATKLVVSWQLDDVDDGISTLTAHIGNPDGQLSGYIHTETDMTLRYGYWNGSMSQPVTMKIKDKKEIFPTSHPCTITVVGMDCTERLIGSTLTGNFKSGTKFTDQLNAILKAGKITPDINVKDPPKQPEKSSIHNMTPHATIRWIFGMVDCVKPTAVGGGSTPGAAQVPFGKPDGFNGDVTQGYHPQIHDFNAAMKKTTPLYLDQIINKAGSRILVAHLECAGIPGLQAKKCVTVQNVGSEASGKWYVKKCSTRYLIGHGYTNHLDLIRASIGKDGKPLPQPRVMYAKIYEKDAVWIGCREIDADSQYTFVFGQPGGDEPGSQQLIQFDWGVKIQRARGAVEGAAIKGYELNNRKELSDTQKKPNGTPEPQSSIPQINVDTMMA